MDGNNEYYFLNLNEFVWLREWLREWLRDQPILQPNHIFMGGVALTQHIFVRYMVEIRIRLGISTRETMDVDMEVMSGQLSTLQVTRCDLFYNILRFWLSENEHVNLFDLARHLDDIGMPSLAESIRSLSVHFTLPLHTNQLRYIQNDQLIFRLNENLLTASHRQLADLPVVNCEGPSASVVGNALLLEQIFAYLSRPCQENFRLASQILYENTLRVWRRTATYRVHTHHPVEIIFGVCSCTIRHNEHGLNFLKLLQLSQNQENQVLPNADERLDLFMDRYPVRSLFVSYRRARISNYRSEYTPLLSSPGEVDYFASFGYQLHKLSLCCTSIGGWIDASTQRFEQKLQWLVVIACPNLQCLELNHVISDPNISIMPVQATQHEEHAAEQMRVEPNRVNLNLTILNLYLWHTPHFVSLLLSLCPNVQMLYADSPTDLEGLVLPTNIGTRIKLHHLELFYGGNRYNYLRQYVSHFPQTLRILNFHNLDLKHVRNAPFDEYACIGKCVNLTRLTLTMHVEANVFQKWYHDLSQFIFPMLESLSITFSRAQQQTCVNNMLRFDFHTLKNLANLQALSINYIGWNEEHRDEAALVDDYFYNGERNNFIPARMTPRFPDINTPLVCTSLRNLEFTCWILTGQDIANFFLWFPNLNKLLIRANEETLQSLPTFAFRLSKLLLLTTRPLSLRHFIAIQARNLGLKIFVKANINPIDNIHKIVVRNERIMFEQTEPSDWSLE